MTERTNAERLFALVHAYAVLPESVAHNNSPMVRSDRSFDVESFRVEAETLSKEQPAMRQAVARVHLSLSELHAAAAKLTTKTNWSDQQLFSSSNPCHSIWESLQKDIGAFDDAFKAHVWQRKQP